MLAATYAVASRIAGRRGIAISFDSQAVEFTVIDLRRTIAAVIA
jgi:hypothetical protein